MDDIREGITNLVIAELGDEVLEAIRADERELIIEFIRSEEWMYECGEEIADAIEECLHYDEEDIH